MITRRLLADEFISTGQAIYFSDHTLITEQTRVSYACREHVPGIGILTMLSGCGRFVLNGGASLLGADQYLLINAGSRLSIQLPDADVRPLFLFFHSRLVAGMLVRQGVDLCWLERVHPADERLRERLMWLARLGGGCSSFGMLKADAIIRDVLGELIRQAVIANREAERLGVSRRTTRVDLYKRLSMAREWIMAHYMRSGVSLQDMAEQAMLNRQHFLRMFKDLYDVTPHQFVIDLRLKAAQRLLKDTELPVADVCRRTGFDSCPSFSELFRRRVGVAPGRYRKMVGTG